MIIGSNNCLTNAVNDTHKNIIPGLGGILMDITAIKGLDLPDIYRRSVTEKIFSRIHHFIKYSSKDIWGIDMDDIVSYLAVPYVNMPVLHLLYKAVTNTELPPIVVESYLLTKFCDSGYRSLRNEEKPFFTTMYNANGFFLRKPSFSGSSAVYIADMRMHSKIEQFTTPFDNLIKYVEKKGDIVAIDDDGYYMSKGAFYGEKFILDCRNKTIPPIMSNPDHVIITKPVSDIQRSAVVNVITSNSKIECITGPAGSGKSFVVSEIVDNAHMQGKNILCCSFTGKAASRMEQSDIDIEKLIMPPKTIHSMISTLKVQSLNGLVDADIIIIDEASTMSSDLFNDLVRAVDSIISDPRRVKYLLVGDKNQLPPIGGGQIFEDIIVGNLFPVHELTEIFRTTDEDLLSLYGAVLNKPQISPADHKKFFGGYDHHNKEVFLESLVDRLFKNDIGWYKDNKCIMLAHTNKYIDYINYLCYKRLQNKTIDWYEVLFDDATEDEEEIKWESIPVFWVGSKIVFTMNDRIEDDKNEGTVRVNNGTVAEVISVGRGFAQVRSLDDDTVFFLSNTYESVKLAFALTVFKSQGSEADYVIYIHSNNIYESKRLIYTAITRARKNLKIFTPMDSFKMSIDVPRYTELNS